jgi:hypothetical protein
MTAKLIGVDGGIQLVYPRNGKKFSYPELHGFADGYIEVLRVPGNQYERLTEPHGLIAIEAFG